MQVKTRMHIKTYLASVVLTCEQTFNFYSKTIQLTKQDPNTQIIQQYILSQTILVCHLKSNVEINYIYKLYIYIYACICYLQLLGIMSVYTLITL